MIVDPSTFVTWAAMRPRVLLLAPECPSFLIDEALRDAADEFFRDSRVWRSSHGTLLTTVASTSVYAYTPPTNAEVVAVQTAWVSTTELDIEKPGESDDEEPGDTEQFPKIGARPTNKLRLTPLPSVVGQVIAGTLSFKPSTDAVGIPTEAWNGWADEIAKGAAAIRARDGDKPWSNPTAVAMWRKEFEAGVMHAGSTAGPTRRRPVRVRVW